MNTHPNDVVSLLAGSYTIPAGNGLPALSVNASDPLGLVVDQSALRMTQDPQDGVTGAQPRDTRTRTQRAADDAAGKVYNPADGTYSTPTPGGSTTPSTIDGGGFWSTLQQWLAHPVDSATSGVMAGIKSSLLLIVLIILGLLFVALGGWFIVDGGDMMSFNSSIKDGE